MALAHYYNGQDIILTIDLKDRNFADQTDVIVEFYHNETLVKTLKKSESDSAKQLLAISGHPTQFAARMFRSETTSLEDGRLRVAIAVITPDTLFPLGRADKIFAEFGKFVKL